MKCFKCEEEGIYDSQGGWMCKDHFLNYFENKVFRTIKKHKLFSQDDKICVGASGGKDSTTALYLTMKFCRERSIDFFAVTVDEGIGNYREESIQEIKKFCKEHDIHHIITSFKEHFGVKLDDIKDKAMEQLNKKPCTVCGVLRRSLLNKVARELKATKLVIGHNLDDSSQSYLMNTLLGNMSHNAALGPISGLTENKKFVARVKPLYFILEEEVILYCKLREFPIYPKTCPNRVHAFRATILKHLNEIENKYPGCKNSTVNAFLEILPTLKQKYKRQEEFNYCKNCGDVAKSELCNACTLLKELK